MNEKRKSGSLRRLGRYVFGVLLALSCWRVFAGTCVLKETVYGRPNLVEGGYVYSYESTTGNAPYWTENANVLGRLPHHVDDYIPPMGQTNAVFLARAESFSVPTNFEFVGTSSYGTTLVTNDTKTGNLHYFFKDGRMVFKASNSLWASPDKYAGGDTVDCYFRHALPGGEYEYGRLQLFFVNRSDAFYRMPRNDTYYVRTGTTLWFCDFDGKTAGVMKWSPWATPNGEAMTANYTCDDWSFTKCTALDSTNKGYFDTFTIHAAPNTTLHLKSVDGTRDVTVHVVDANFKFTSHTLFFKYGATKNDFETRTLSTILYECKEPYALSDIASVESVDAVKGVAVVKNDATGDYALTPRDYHEFDRYVIVTLTENRGVILLKITSFPGRYDETLCARVLPEVVCGNFQNLILNDSGATYKPADWEKNFVSRNAPPGYTNIVRTAACVLFEGKRYSVCVASRTEEIIANKDGSLGQTDNILGFRKVIAWLEDLDGNRFVNPLICVGNAGFSDLLGARISLGTANCLYTNDGKLSISNGQYCNDYFLGTVLSASQLFQGTTPDSYGYYALEVGSGFSGVDGSLCWCDELSVFQLAGQHTVTVTKEVVGGNPADRFLFEETHTILDGDNVVDVTNMFTLAGGESWSFVMMTNGNMRVTEIVNPGYVANVKTAGEWMYVRTNEVAATGVTQDLAYVFRNDDAGGANPVRLWITDHFDAGSNKVHLAFEPFFDRENVPLDRWLRLAREQDAIHVVHSADEAGLATGKLETVTFRGGTGDQDIDKRWVWITKDASKDDDQKLLQIVVSPVRAATLPYQDDTLSSTLSMEGNFTKTTVDESTALYCFTNLDQTAEIKINRASRVKSVVLVGGGGGGGAGGVGIQYPYGTGGGGGGGGGEVRCLTGDQLGTNVFDPGQTFWIDVGAGGAPSPFIQVPGDNGGETRLTFTDGIFRALGGGGGGSSLSQFPGIPNYSNYGYGRPGANGGGGAYNQAGGARTVENGYSGGNAYSQAGNGVGGGGGMAAVGGNGTTTNSGDGGEGLRLTVGARSDIYGAGGGGGGKLLNGAVSRVGGQGGTHAGRGAYDVLEHALAGDGDNGFGAGGGGGGDKGTTGNIGCGGRGGCGTVLIELQDASQLDAFTSVTSVGTSTADLSATLAAFAPGKGQTASVYFGLARGTDEFVFSDTPLATDVVAGGSIQKTAFPLWSNCSYRYAFKFVDDAGRTLVTSGGFHTEPLDFPVAFEDDSLVVEAGGEVQELHTGDYLVTFTNTAATARIVAKEDLVILQTLIVGGGGGGGCGASAAGGGGGEVRVLDDPIELAYGTDLTALVGAGGSAATVVGNIGTSGDNSTLTVGETSYTAIGGGGGASASNYNGGNGANGGGATRGTASAVGAALPGTSTSGTGFAGGGTEKFNNNSIWCAGGGGGAAEPGQTGYVVDTDGFAGKGGQGLAYGFGEEFDIYGSGGGAGNNVSAANLANSCGGLHAGEGGDGRLTETESRVGKPGTDGFGAGGGGGSYAGGSHFTGGRGGAGVVKLRLARRAALPLAVSARVTDPGCFSVTLNAKVVALGASQTATVSLAYTKRGGATVDCGVIGTDLAAGATISRRLSKLSQDTWYDYTLTVVGSSGESQTVKGAFKTWRLENPNPVCFEDENFVFFGRAGGADIFERLPSEEGTYLFRFTNPAQAVSFAAKDTMILTDALVVGGGGAGGTYMGGGGAGGQVLPLSNLDVTLTDSSVVAISVATGGVWPTTGYTVNGVSGGNSTLTIGGTVYTAQGGGGGASWGCAQGSAGANGGGGAGNGTNNNGGRGGAGGEYGYAGGNVGKGTGWSKDCAPGGGGGAGGPGENGYFDVALQMGRAGRGGAGVANGLSGEMVVYGAGGGGGGGNNVTNNVGGENAGCGGDHKGTGDARYGANGVNGTGAGGGGGSYVGPNSADYYHGGAGGSGVVILKLRVLPSSGN